MDNSLQLQLMSPLLSLCLLSPLLWKFASNALLTNERRVNRRIASDPSCPRCGQNVENDDHVFRWNGNSKAIWYLDSRRSAAGGVFRNQVGAIVFAFAANIVFCSLMLAELWTIYIGISIAWTKGFRKFIVESDSKLAMYILIKGCTPPSSLLQYSPVHSIFCCKWCSELEACLEGGEPSSR